MDGGTIAALCTGAGGLLVSLTGVVTSLRRMDPENVKLLKTRVEAAEHEVKDLRGKLLIAEGTIFRLKQLAAQHGWIDETEVIRGEDGPQ